MWPANQAFSEQLPALQIFWDSTSLGALKKCPRYYQLTIVEGWSARGRKLDLEFGLFLHAARERYYHARASGADHDAAVDAAFDWLLTATWDETLDRPWIGDQYKNRFTLARTLVWYLDQWEHDPLATVIQADGKPAVELSFRFALDFGPYGGEFSYDPIKDEGGETKFYLCGHLDRLVRFNDRLWISDLKTTKNALDAWYFAQFSPHNQMSCYSLGGQVALSEPCAGIIIDAVQIGVGFSRSVRGQVQRTQAQLEEFLRSLRVLLTQAETYARANFWPMNETQCWNCEFRSICAKSPNVREKWLAADFVRRTWDPTVARGDV